VALRDEDVSHPKKDLVSGTSFSLFQTPQEFIGGTMSSSFQTPQEFP
jgi:hypothetical protein